MTSSGAKESQRLWLSPPENARRDGVDDTVARERMREVPEHEKPAPATE
jgi:hypothetical protein